MVLYGSTYLNFLIIVVKCLNLLDNLSIKIYLSQMHVIVSFLCGMFFIHNFIQIVECGIKVCVYFLHKDYVYCMLFFGLIKKS